MQYQELCLNIGLKIKYYRQLRHFTQAKLAEKIDMDIRYLSEIERGKKNITLKTLYKLSVTLGIQPKDLFIFPAIPPETEQSE